jgi:hypothetical protein
VVTPQKQYTMRISHDTRAAWWSPPVLRGRSESVAEALTTRDGSAAPVAAA